MWWRMMAFLGGTGIYGEIKMELKHCTWKIVCDPHTL
jgi:hypothetical protein